MSSDDRIAVRLEGVSKRFTLNPNRRLNVRDLLLRPHRFVRQFREQQPYWALRDVSLTINRGESVGIIGPNGAGKTTLLQVLAGLSSPTVGKAEVYARCAALLDLGAGLHPQATGRDNAYVNALFMGLSKEEAREKMPDIIEFSGLGAFIDQPMRTYSSGMYLRLGFAVAAHVRPEILLIDEIIAVGDAAFQRKCLNHFDKLRNDGTTIVLVTHNFEFLENVDRVLLLEQGRVTDDGKSEEVVLRYIVQMLEESPATRADFERALKRVWMPTRRDGQASRHQAGAASPTPLN